MHDYRNFGLSKEERQMVILQQNIILIEEDVAKEKGIAIGRNISNRS